MDLSKYTALFLAESREHLNACNGSLLEWEREPAAVEPVGRLFRAIHTIQGMAATVGCAISEPVVSERSVMPRTNMLKASFQWSWKANALLGRWTPWTAIRSAKSLAASRWVRVMDSYTSRENVSVRSTIAWRKATWAADAVGPAEVAEALVAAAQSSKAPREVIRKISVSRSVLAK